MKTLFRQLLVPAAVLAAASAFADSGSQPLDISGIDAARCIAGTTAAGTPSAYNNRAPVRAFDGSGIAAGGTCGVTADNEMFMLSSNNSGSFPWYIQVDLGETKRLDGVKLYNFNFAKNGTAYTERGVREFKLFVSTGDTWKTSAADIQSNYSLVLSNQLARATGTADYAGEYFAFATPVSARFVALVALDDWDDSRNVLNYNGISEIQLFSSDEEPPDTPAADVPRYSICCVGDSITEGANSSEAANKWTYRTYLAQMLAESGLGDVEWKGSHVSPNSGNELPSEGWSGQNAEQIASKYIANAEGDKADILLLHAGHNYNVDPNTSSPAYRPEAEIVAAATNAHARIIAAAREQNPNVTVLYAKVITSGKLPKYSYIPALNDAIGALAAELNTAASPIRVVDMADGWDWTVHCTDDKVHPTESGARLMASKWVEALMASPFMSGTDAVFPQTLGVAPPDWGWVDAGSVRVAAGQQRWRLRCAFRRHMTAKLWYNFRP